VRCAPYRQGASIVKHCRYKPAGVSFWSSKNMLHDIRFDRRTMLAGAASLSLLPAPSLGSAPPDPAVWTKLPTEPFKGKQDDIFFTDALTGWYGNGEGKLYRTTDGGDSWTRVWTQAGTFIRALGFADADNGWLGNVGVDYYPGVTDRHPLYRTRDGGVSWTAVAAEGIAKVSGICGIDIVKRRAIYQGELRDQVIVHAAGRVGSSAWLMRSTDGGASFRVIDMNPHCGMILDVKFRDAMTGFICAASSADLEQANAVILRTADGGATWQTVYRSARRFENVWKMHWAGAKTGYASVQSYDPDATRRVIVKTVDGGKSWRELALVDDAKVREFGIGFATEKHGFVGTTTGGFETRDGGRNWARSDMGRAVNKIRVIRRADGGLRLFAIGVDVYRLDLG
jgi:photosystem II stability/assembly factor-like uncharacterized protein